MNYRITQINIDFEDDNRSSHAMDPVFCIDKLELLPDEHILAEHRKNTEEIEKLAKKEPAELIIKIVAINKIIKFELIIFNK